jgi:undecaprenyl-diphosphatase
VPFSRILSHLRGGKTELRVLGGFFAVALFLLVFERIAAGVAEGSLVRFDEALLLALRNPADLSDPIGPTRFEGTMRDITALGSTFVVGLISLSAIIYLLMVRQRTSASLVGISVFGGWLLGNLLKLVYARPRPDLVPPSVDVFSSSFPSGHATLSAVTYLALGALLAELHSSRAAKLYFLGLAVLITVAVGLTRVYLGVHYPSDVLAGWCAGAGWAVLCRTLMLGLRRRAS